MADRSGVTAKICLNDRWRIRNCITSRFHFFSFPSRFLTTDPWSFDFEFSLNEPKEKKIECGETRSQRRGKKSMSSAADPKLLGVKQEFDPSKHRCSIERHIVIYNGNCSPSQFNRPWWHLRMGLWANTKSRLRPCSHFESQRIIPWKEIK